MRPILIFALMTLAGVMVGQSSELPNNYRAYHAFDRLEILYGNRLNHHSAFRNLLRKDIVKVSVDIQKSGEKLKPLEIEDLIYFYKDNNEWVRWYRDTFLLNNLEYPYYKSKKLFLKKFYKTPANLWEIDKDNFHLRVNPIIHFSFGEAAQDDEFIFQNTRGFDIRGVIDNKVFFYTSLFETQRRFYNFIENKISKFNAIPGQGNYKSYDSGIIDNVDGWDYLNAQAYVGLNISKSISMQFGHGKNFIGNGYHSLLLSDYGHNYFYLKFNTKFWIIHYQNIFAELSAFGSLDNTGDVLLPKKYMAAHYLDFNILANLSIGIFESVVFSRINNFEFQYLNPLILYRTVESFLDSPDNILIGLNAHWNFLNQFQLYSQLVLDEFKLDQFTQGQGWWGNKYGLQLGVKYINVFQIDHLDAQLEYNSVRPYTFAHRDTITGTSEVAVGSYSHYNQALAHPLGANFKEWLFKLRYQPIHKLVMEGRIILAEFGDDVSNQNWGGNILKPFTTRVQDFDNEIGQGDHTNITNIGLDVSYMIRHNFFLDLNILFRKEDHSVDEKDIDTKYIGLGIRLNVANQRLDY